jgi:hypothetical protein
MAAKVAIVRTITDRLLVELENRFTDKIAFEPNTGCWLWTGAKAGRTNYGQFKVFGVDYLAHRFAYEYFVDEIPDGLVIDHLCDMPQCVNPKHLRVCTQKENVHRSAGIAAINRSKTHCSKGHRYDTDNTRIYNRKRYCIKCSHGRSAYAAIGLKELQ